MAPTLAPPTTDAPPCPPLRDGERMTWDEFERRWHATPFQPKAELIHGVVHMSALRFAHGRDHLRLARWLTRYEDDTPHTTAIDNTTVRLDDESNPQPDLALQIDPDAGGQVFIDEYVHRCPELVCEVAGSSAGVDYGEKLPLYRQHGAHEVLIWRIYDGEVDWFRFDAGAERRIEPDAAGVARSEAFPGLWLNVPALVGGDRHGVAEMVRLGLASPEHAAFVEQLIRAAARGAP